MSTNCFRMSLVLLLFSTPLLFSQNDPGGGGVGVGVSPQWEISDEADKSTKVLDSFRKVLNHRLGSALDAAIPLLENSLENQESREQMLLTAIDAMELVATAARELRAEERSVRRMLSKRAKSLSSGRKSAASQLDARLSTIPKIEVAISRVESEAAPIAASFLKSIEDGNPDLALEEQLYHQNREVADLQRKLRMQSALAEEDRLAIRQFQSLLAENVVDHRNVDGVFDELGSLEDNIGIVSYRFQRHLRDRERGDHRRVLFEICKTVEALNLEAFGAFLSEADGVIDSGDSMMGAHPGPFSVDPAENRSKFRAWVERVASPADGADIDEVAEVEDATGVVQ